MTIAVLDSIQITDNSPNVTVPEGTKAAIFTWAYYGNAASGGAVISAVTLGGASPANIDQVPDTPGPEFAVNVGVAVWINPASGSRTLSQSFSNSPIEGPIRFITFLGADGDLSVRALDSKNHTGQASNAALSLTLSGLESGDFVLAFDEHYQTAPDNQSGWTSVISADASGQGGRVRHITSSGSSVTANAQSPDFSALAMVAFYEEGGDLPPVISSGTPSGTIGTANTATVGCTTDTEEGTLYVVLSETDNVKEADPEEIEAGENENGNPADFADNVEVVDSSPSVTFSGVLTPETTYYYAMVHKTDDGYSNVLSGSFTTAAVDIVATKLVFTAQPGNTVVGQTMSAVQVAAVDGDNELDTDFDGNVTISLQTGDGTLLGTLTKAAVGGIATFDDISINTLNTAAVIRASADGLTYADSAPFDVTAGGSGAAGFPSSSRLGGVLQ